MDAPTGLKLTAAEITRLFAQGNWAEKFPPVLTIEQASELLQVPIETLRNWRSRGLLGGCSRRVGKRVRFLRDRLVLWYFDEATPGA